MTSVLVRASVAGKRVYRVTTFTGQREVRHRRVQAADAKAAVREALRRRLRLVGEEIVDVVHHQADYPVVRGRFYVRLQGAALAAHTGFYTAEEE